MQQKKNYYDPIVLLNSTVKNGTISLNKQHIYQWNMPCLDTSSLTLLTVCAV
jgi:hypothetical protein